MVELQIKLCAVLFLPNLPSPLLSFLVFRLEWQCLKLLSRIAAEIKQFVKPSKDDTKALRLPHVLLSDNEPGFFWPAMQQAFVVIVDREYSNIELVPMK